MSSLPAEPNDWCLRWLGASLDTPLFTTRGVSRVLGVRLIDGREVVIKVRHAEPRYYGCAAAHQRVWQAGYACPEPLAGPAPLGDELATAERFVPGGTLLEPSVANAERYAWALAELVRLAPSPAELPPLDPPPAWAWWDYPGPGLWAWQSAAERALAAERGWTRPALTPELAWLKDLAVRTRARLFRVPFTARRRPRGLVDGESSLGRGKLFVVHDWDSLAAQPEAIICGFAASTFHDSLATWVQAELAQGEAFIVAYERARPRVECGGARGLLGRGAVAQQPRHLCRQRQRNVCSAGVPVAIRAS